MDTDETGRGGQTPHEGRPRVPLSSADMKPAAQPRPEHPEEVWTAPQAGVYDLTWRYEISPCERSDEQRRHRDEFDEDYFQADPFGRFIQSILDEDRGRPA